MDYRQFFGRKPRTVARDLLGMTLRAGEDGLRNLVIVETAAYEGGKITPRREGMLWRPGTIYLMNYRGHKKFNVATDKEGIPSCVEIRAVLEDEERIAGSAKLTNLLGLQEVDGQYFSRFCELVEAEFTRQVGKEVAGSDNCLAIYSI